MFPPSFLKVYFLKEIVQFSNRRYIYPNIQKIYIYTENFSGNVYMSWIT